MIRMKALLATIFVIFAPAKGMLVTAAVLIIIDMLTGIMASRKRREPITSAGISRSIAKFAVYEIAIGLAFICQTFLTGPEIPLAHIVASLIGMSELLSCYENINELSNQNLLKSIIDKISSQNKN